MTSGFRATGQSAPQLDRSFPVSSLYAPSAIETFAQRGNWPARKGSSGPIAATKYAAIIACRPRGRRVGISPGVMARPIRSSTGSVVRQRGGTARVTQALPDEVPHPGNERTRRDTAAGGVVLESAFATEELCRVRSLSAHAVGPATAIR